MWRSKKFIIIAVIAAVVLASSISGVVLAQSDNGEDNPEIQQAALIEKVCAIYEQSTGVAIDATELQKALDQARDEMQSEALNNFLQKLVDEGKITQEEADQYQAWLEARPDIGIPIAPGMGGHGMHPGFGGPGGEPPAGGEPQSTE